MSFSAELETAAAQVRDSVRAALENGTPLRVAAAGGWLDAGRPVGAADRLSPGPAGIVEYVPGDLTITARAGTPLRDIAQLTAPHNQWLPLDPFGSPNMTIGATVATASAGPLAHAFGTPRDQVIGLGFVTGRGDYVRSGGRVVKNVAGFDLTRLLIGSWGTLGVITDATLRLRARPEAERTIALIVSADSVKFRETLAAVMEAQIAPLALELLNGVAARAVGADDDDTLLLVRLGGNRAVVAAQRELFGRLGEIRDAEPTVWDRLRQAEPAGAATVRVSGPLIEFGSLWLRLQRELGPAAPFMHGTPARGVVRCAVPYESAGLLSAIGTDGDQATRIFERLPADAWARVPATAASSLSHRVREAFDPAMLLNPGILGHQVS
ncbi:MAG TPA: FAD-binding protein [Gemmatimonadaceae bacterium]